MKAEAWDDFLDAYQKVWDEKEMYKTLTKIHIDEENDEQESSSGDSEPRNEDFAGE